MSDSEDTMFSDFGICIKVNVCHAPVVKEMSLRQEVFDFLEENFGKGASSFEEWITNPAVEWYTNNTPVGVDSKERKGYKDEMILIWIRNPSNASYFVLRFSTSGTSTNWGNDL